MGTQIDVRQEIRLKHKGSVYLYHKKSTKFEKVRLTGLPRIRSPFLVAALERAPAATFTSPANCTNPQPLKALVF